ncbi:C-reactive protein 1.1-like [Centruroides vittatus]|uniref:C-reactive protein 1.1-like n=1 Tax=Centruroides vittatus TaxID=120091 RepID=UPI00350F0F10
MLHIITCALFFLTLSECSLLKIHFPRLNEGFPRLRMDGNFPSLTECTLCLWIKPHSFQKEYSMLFSYAKRFQNEFAGCISNISGSLKVGIDVMNEFIEFECPNIKWEVGEWYHICASWFSTNGHLKVYTNGEQCFTTSHSEGIIGKGGYIHGGGIFVLGQDQDALDGGYDANQSWHGDIVDLHIWDEVLTEEQIVKTGLCDHKHKEGNVIAGMKTPMSALDVVISQTELCET